MGWWEAKTLDNQFLILGDVPADILGCALEEIVRVYEKDVGRKPYREEVQKLINFVVRPFLEYELNKKEKP